MAKCIKITYSVNNTKDAIKRVSDDVARKAVVGGIAVYVPKRVWKKEVRDNG